MATETHTIPARLFLTSLVGSKLHLQQNSQSAVNGRALAVFWQNGAVAWKEAVLHHREAMTGFLSRG